MAGNRMSWLAMCWRARMDRSSWVTPSGYRSRTASKSHRSAPAAYPASSRSSSARRLRAAFRLVACARATSMRAASVIAAPKRPPHPNTSSIARVMLTADGQHVRRDVQALDREARLEQRNEDAARPGGRLQDASGDPGQLAGVVPQAREGRPDRLVELVHLGHQASVVPAHDRSPRLAITG